MVFWHLELRPIKYVILFNVFSNSYTIHWICTLTVYQYMAWDNDF